MQLVLQMTLAIAHKVPDFETFNAEMLYSTLEEIFSVQDE